MPRVEMKPLSPDEQALVMRLHEVLKDAKVGEVTKLPADLAKALDDAAVAAAAPVIMARRRMEWLHSRDACNVDGYEWGVFRVKWENGRAVEVWQTAADFSDLDDAMQWAHRTEIGVAGLTRDGNAGVPGTLPAFDSPSEWKRRALEAEAALRAHGVAEVAKTDSRCTYLATHLCNKCGREHDGQPNPRVPFGRLICWGLTDICAELSPKCRAAGLCVLAPQGEQK